MDRAPSTLVVTPYLRAQQAIYRGSRGWVGRRLTVAPSLLLTTVGRKTGRRRTRALIYYKDDATWVVVASNGGSDRGPAWLANLEAEPKVVVQDGRRKWAAQARVASPEERARLWPFVNRNNRGLAFLLHRGAQGRYDVYQRSTSRQIPIVILERTEEKPFTRRS
jgi:deazaflavin-dependent oxidoreductase (nitroreductase family)